MTEGFDEAADQIAAIGRRFDARGWVLGTSGNFSVRRQRAPLQIAITRSGAHKGTLIAAALSTVLDRVRPQRTRACQFVTRARAGSCPPASP